MGKRARKRNIILATIVAFIMTIIIGVGGIRLVKANKINSAIELGNKYLSEGNYKEAILEFEKAIKIDNKNVDSYLGLAEVYIAEKQFEKAIDLYTEAKEKVKEDDKKIIIDKIDDLIAKVKVENIVINCKKGDKIILPENIVVKIEDNSVPFKVIWEESKIDTSEDKTIEVKGNISKINKEIKATIIIKSKLEYDGVTADLTGLEEFNTFESDVNQDEIKDSIVVWGKEVGMDRVGEYIVIYDGETKEILTTIPDPGWYAQVSEMEDINEDNIPEMIVTVSSGGSAGGGAYLLEYKNGTYVKSEFEEAKAEITMLDDYKIEITDSINGITKTTTLREEQKQLYTDFEIYNSSGTLINSDELLMGNRGNDAKFIDIDNDNKLEYVFETMINGVNNGDSLVLIIYVYEYKDGKLVIKDIIGQAGGYSYDPEYVD